MKIYLDMDGVLFDFLGAALNENGIRLNGYSDIDIMQKDAFTIFNNNEEKFWHIIDSAGENFWVNLPMFSWTFPLYNYLISNYKEVYFCSTPSRAPQSASGKLRCIIRHFGINKSRDYVLTPKKELLANYQSVLINDKKSSIKKFRMAGGHGVLFPMGWNDNCCVDKVDFVIRKLDEIHKTCN